MNEAGERLIKSFEGLRLNAYKCPAGVWTIGYGHTGPSVKEGVSISKKQADTIFKLDIKKYEIAVRSEVKDLQLNENQISALTSLCYNIGISAFKKSTLLKKLKSPGTLKVVIKFQWYRWVFVKGKKFKGLINRRIKELELFYNKV